MAQTKQSYYKKHNNKSYRKRYFIDKDTENNLFAIALVHDEPKKVLQSSFTKFISEEEAKKFKSPNKELIDNPKEDRINCLTSNLVDLATTDDCFYPKDFNYRKYSRDSTNDSTSNDESHKTPVIFPKSKADNFKIKYKTELCKFFEINGQCKYGDNCAYAHGKETLRLKVTNSSAYRTRKCKQFFENGFCPYGNRCQFAHALQSNILNNPYAKNISYAKTMRLLSKKDNLGNVKSLITLPRLPFFESITQGDCKSTLFEDIKNVENVYVRNDNLDVEEEEEIIDINNLLEAWLRRDDEDTS